ncbi:hypothetical protein DPMN_078281 [Dreissena polymorpha]|uniref:Uncharacterized protein n=1 Tax=Dreissena polymorpha TaxID=45954 RepID=A0A9D3YQU3_DREPO|nr:hypothetical protein DPMN_078281 [Dreissena polymorpha]
MRWQSGMAMEPAAFLLTSCYFTSDGVMSQTGLHKVRNCIVLKVTCETDVSLQIAQRFEDREPEVIIS